MVNNHTARFPRGHQRTNPSLHFSRGIVKFIEGAMFVAQTPIVIHSLTGDRGAEPHSNSIHKLFLAVRCAISYPIYVCSVCAHKWAPRGPPHSYRSAQAQGPPRTRPEQCARVCHPNTSRVAFTRRPASTFPPPSLDRVRGSGPN